MNLTFFLLLRVPSTGRAKCMCTHPSSRRKSGRLHNPLFHFDSTKRRATPDDTTYGTFLQACVRLLPQDESRKWLVVETVFNSCVKEGQCGELVLKNLKGVATPELYDVLVGRFLTDDGLDVPLQWRRNVAGKERRKPYYFH